MPSRGANGMETKMRFNTGEKIVFSYVTFWVLFFGFWVVNIIQILAYHSIENVFQNTELVLKILGVIFVPLGSVMGFVGLF